MRRKNRPVRWRRIVRLRSNGSERSQAYVISGRAQAVLSAVLESILDECLQEAENLATAAGKSCVTPEEMEKALKNLCLRLNAQPSRPGKQKVSARK
ncbi:uncharacterized protein LOC112590537 isoform X2 [Harpegnathos saltator]|uniref:uncharacterized protein LOC112590537 isoform X2 n=1 Tax=Harpegnathos saltator TaxID=610380 RepID=UPI000DBEE11C|nr:uncharacterized protein LOC112590537 isoform X2 [Harpegnathos saltator]